MCVTKGHPVEVAAAAVGAGFVDLGESYAQELVPKAAALASSPAEPRWHFIGRLQSNKVRSVAAAVVTLWHTVDRASLAAEIAKRAPGASVLVQLDLAGLPGRGGCAPGDAPALVRSLPELGLDVRGPDGRRRAGRPRGCPAGVPAAGRHGRSTSVSRSGRWA